MRALLEKIDILRSNYGVSVEYSLDPDEKVNAFANGMLTYNSIKGVLGYIYESNGGQRRLRFNKPNGIQLSLLMEQPLKKSLILGILSSISDALNRAEEFMLDECGFVLDPQLIFVNTSTLSTELVYIPTGIEYDCPYRAFVKTLMYSCIVSTDEDTSYVQQIVNFINSNHSITRAELAEFIKSLASAPQTVSSANRVPVMQAARQAQPIPSAQTAAVHAAAAPAFNAPPPAQPTQTEEKSKKGGLFSGIIGKKKTEKPEKSVKAPKAPASGDSGFGFNIPGQKPASAQDAPQRPDLAPAAGVSPRTPAPQTPAPAFSYAPAAPAAAVADEPFDDPSGKTVLLGMDDDQADSIDRKFLLERKNGEKIFINKSMFFIGKADKSDIQNDYIIRNSAVSRNHAYFQMAGGGVTVTDNNSLNGTFINDEKIPGLVQRELKNGDVVRLADEVFVFKIQ